MKESGIGRENGIEAFEACKSVRTHHEMSTMFNLRAHFHADSQSKSTIVNTATVEETREQDDWFGGEAENKRYG